MNSIDSTRGRAKADDALLLDGLVDDDGQKLVQRILDDAVAPHDALDHRAGGLATPKAGHVDAAGEPAEGLLHGSIEALLLDLDVERNLAGRDFGAGNLQ